MKKHRNSSITKKARVPYGVLQTPLDIISYFVFDGSGKGNNNYKSNSIIEIKDNNIVFIRCVFITETNH